jgi:hypothetical protein
MGLVVFMGPSLTEQSFISFLHVNFLCLAEGLFVELIVD